MFEFLINQLQARAPVVGEPAFTIRRIDGEGLHISDYGKEALRPWRDVHSVHALSRKPIHNSGLALVITFTDQRVALVCDDDAQWYALALALPRCLHGVPTYSEWAMRLHAEPHATLKLF